MTTFVQDPVNDFALVEGQLILTDDVAEEACIELRNKFQFVQGEYFLDTRQGVPYFTVVFLKNPDVLLIKQLFRSIILGTSGIREVISMTAAISPQRKLSYSFRARAINGRIISGGSGQPFIVEAP